MITKRLKRHNTKTSEIQKIEETFVTVMGTLAIAQARERVIALTVKLLNSNNSFLITAGGRHVANSATL